MIEESTMSTIETDVTSPVIEEEFELIGEPDKATYATDVKPTRFKETHPCVTDDADKRGRLALHTFNLPTKVVFSWLGNKPGVLSEEHFASATYHHAPSQLQEEVSADSDWDQNLECAGTKIGVGKVKFGNTGELKGEAAIELIRRRGGNGTSIRFPLLRSCIWVTMRPPSEQELADVEYKLSSDENSVGRSTAGILLNAGSGSFNEALIELALSLIIATNVSNLNGGMVKALRDRIDIMDYTDLIAGMLISSYPDGYPWEFTCGNPSCGHVVKDQTVNFARMLWHDKSQLNDKQLNELIKRRNAITDNEIESYKSEFKLTDKDFVLLKHADIKIHFKSSNLSDYLTVSKQWISNIENKYTTSLTKYTTEEQRASFINTQIQINRFSKYLHLVDKISIPNEDGGDEQEITDRDTITMAMTAIDTTNDDFVTFEEAALKYIEAHSLTIFGYPSIPCKACGVEPETTNGKFSTIVPVSPDRTFFTLARLKTMEMNQLGAE